MAKPLDDRNAWVVTCLVVRRSHRVRGVARALVAAATDWAFAHDADVVEGFPIDPRGRKPRSSEAFHGVVSMFEDAGYQEVARRTPARPYMRHEGG